MRKSNECDCEFPLPMWAAEIKSNSDIVIRMIESVMIITLCISELIEVYLVAMVMHMVELSMYRSADFRVSMIERSQSTSLSKSLACMQCIYLHMTTITLHQYVTASIVQYFECRECSTECCHGDKPSILFDH
jgi:hypothetical protein